MNNYVTEAINLKSYNLNDADKIIVMNNGVISAMGTHEELLKTSSIYKEVYDTQFRPTEGGEA